MAAKAKTKSRAQSRPVRSRSTGRRSTSRPRARGHAALATVARQMTEEMESRAMPTDAIAMLEQDHREVESFLDQFEEAEESAEKAELARKICVALTVHAELEESMFYPQAREWLAEESEEDEELIDEAEVEHMSAKQLIAEIEKMTPREKLFDAKVKVLGEYVKHHVKEEEQEMFPKLRETDMDLEALAETMAEKKLKLFQKMGRK
jgi:hemerythrin superfamily protein